MFKYKNSGKNIAQRLQDFTKVTKLTYLASISINFNKQYRMASEFKILA